AAGGGADGGGRRSRGARARARTRGGVGYGSPRERRRRRDRRARRRRRAGARRRGEGPQLPDGPADEAHAGQGRPEGGARDPRPQAPELTLRVLAALAAALLVAIAVAAWWVPRWLAGEGARERLLAAARDATGRDVACDGLSFGLFPPRLVATGVRVGGAAAPLRRPARPRPPPHPPPLRP